MAVIRVMQRSWILFAVWQRQPRQVQLTGRPRQRLRRRPRPPRKGPASQTPRIPPEHPLRPIASRRRRPATLCGRFR